MSSGDYSVVVGIDFGTTFSGASYGRESSEVYDLTRWPKGRGTNAYAKVPTVSWYDNSTKKLLAWGIPARKESEKVQGHSGEYTFLQKFKILLDDTMGGQLNELPMGLSATNAVADYLRPFHEHVLSEIKKELPFVPAEKFRYCLTVPAMWSDKAKQIMRDAAVEAGIINKDDPTDRLRLISEPEAAAIYCETKCEDFNMSEGEEFMICDAGGGTVDLIVFKVEFDSTGRRRFKECTKGLGKSCGSMMLDRKMKKLLTPRLKQFIKPLRRHTVEHLMWEFIDKHKPNFDGKEDIYFWLPMTPGMIKDDNDHSNGIGDSQLMFTKEEMNEHVFEPVFKDVIDLIYEQKSQPEVKNLKAIFMVGGFGSSEYLTSRVQQVFEPEGISVFRPERSEMAIARGAVHFGLCPDKVTARVPRSWYGIDITKPFEEGIDLPEKKIIHLDGTVRCDNRFSVFVRRGVPLSIDKCITKKYSTYYPRNTACTLYCADTKVEPRYTTDVNVHKVFDFEIPMPYLEGVSHGDPIELTINMYFGEVELRVEAIIREHKYQVTRNFNGDSPHTSQLRNTTDIFLPL